MKIVKNIATKAKKTVLKTYRRVLQSIAFYPILICLLFIFFSLVILQVENVKVSKYIADMIPFLIIEDIDTAKTILSTLIGGILSLTVFSFSMVMVVLNQASSNFSPRLLPGLISNKKHQIILGFYTGTILYSLIALMSLGGYTQSQNYIGFSTMLSALFGIICVGLFIYFIHSISHSIQIDNIVDVIYDRCKRKIEVIIKDQKQCDLNTSDWKTIYSNTSGYYRGFFISFASDYFKKQQNYVEILPYKNQHVWKGDPIMKIKENLPKQELQSLLACFDFSPDRHHGESFIDEMIKLMEVAVRAMSPGVNDPGTAIDAITKLGQVLHLSSKLYPKIIERNRKNKIIFITNTINLEELIRTVIQPIRQYAKKDASVTFELMRALRFVEKNTERKDVILSEIEALRQDVEENIANKKDKDQVLQIID